MLDTSKQLLLSSRPVSWVNTAYPFAAAYFIFTQQIDALFIIGTLFFLIPYNLLMYGINDVFDYESDLHNPRKKGIEGITLRPALHMITIKSAIALCLPFVIALCLLGGLRAAIVLCAILFFVVAYSAPRLRFKERPFIDSATSSMHFVGPLLFAVAAANYDLLPVLPYIAAFFLWGMASHAFGAVQDIAADKAGNIASIATIIGGRRTVWFCAVLYLLASGLLVMQHNIAVTVVAAANLIYVANIVPYLQVTDATAAYAHAGWQRFIYLNYIMGAVVTIALIIALM